MPRPDGKTTSARRTRALALRAEGLSYGAIGQRLGITRQAVASLLTRKPTRTTVRCADCGKVVGEGPFQRRTLGTAWCRGCLARRPGLAYGDRLRSLRLAAGLTR